MNTEILERSSKGEAFGDLKPAHTNIVYAVWFVESRMIIQESEGNEPRFLDNLKRSIPSCFCDQDLIQ